MDANMEIPALLQRRRMNSHLTTAAAIIVVSVLAVAAMVGLLPGSASYKAESTVAGHTPYPQRAMVSALRSESRAVPQFGQVCAICGTVEWIRTVELKGEASGVGVGNEIEKSVKKRYTHRITVHMEDGSYRTVSQPQLPSVAIGEKVRVVDGAVVARS